MEVNPVNVARIMQTPVFQRVLYQTSPEIPTSDSEHLGPYRLELFVKIVFF